MSPRPWFILLSTLSRRDKESYSLTARLALGGADSKDKERSKRRRSALPGVVGDTIEATLMLLVVGDTRGWGSRCCVVVGEGVLSGDDAVRPALGGPRLMPAHDACEVSAWKCQSQNSDK